jgi:hypothetical protein
MEEPGYLLPKYKKEKIYNLYRCPDCYKILRIKILIEGNIIKYSCQCKRDWYISYNIDKREDLLKPRKLDCIFNLKCSYCNQYANLEFKYMSKCLTCKKLICRRKGCKERHSHTTTKNIIYYDITCAKHSKEFLAYCKICDKDLCELCIMDEKIINHDIIYYKDIMPQKDKFIEKYNYFNKFSDLFVTQFKGVSRKTNVRLIYFFHLREILRNCYINFSRYSKINKFNFALISNILENSDFITDSNNPKLILDYKIAPTCIINSSKYFFTFLENKNDTKHNFLKNINNHQNKECNWIKHIYSSFPKNKYFIIQTSILNLYDSKTFELIYKIGDYQIDNVYNFEDERIICNLLKDKSSFLFIKINEKGKNDIKTSIIKCKYDKVYLLKDSFLINKGRKYFIYNDKGKHEFINLYQINVNDIIDLVCVEDCIIYFHEYNSGIIFFYETKTGKMNELDCNSKYRFKSINKLDKKHIIAKTLSHAKINSEYFVINVPLMQIVNKFELKILQKWKNIEIMNEYIIFDNKKNDEKIFINALTLKKKKQLYNLRLYPHCDIFNSVREEIKMIILNKYVALYYKENIVAIYRF